MPTVEDVILAGSNWPHQFQSLKRAAVTQKAFAGLFMAHFPISVSLQTVSNADLHFMRAKYHNLTSQKRALICAAVVVVGPHRIPLATIDIQRRALPLSPFYPPIPEAAEQPKEHSWRQPVCWLIHLWALFHGFFFWGKERAHTLFFLQYKTSCPKSQAYFTFPLQLFKSCNLLRQSDKTGV